MIALFMLFYKCINYEGMDSLNSLILHNCFHASEEDVDNGSNPLKCLYLMIDSFIMLWYIYYVGISSIIQCSIAAIQFTYESYCVVRILCCHYVISHIYTKYTLFL